MAKLYVSAGASSAYGTTITNGLKVKTSGGTTVLEAGKESYGITHDAINAHEDKLLGKKVMVGLNITEPYTNGTASAGSSMTFTFDPAESIKGGSAAGKYITLTATEGEERTYTARDRALASGSVTITNYLHLLPDAVAATATVTITDFTNLNTGDKINLIATDTTNYDFVCGDQSSVAGTWESATSNDATATNLMNVINTSSGPAGTRFTATVSGAVVTVTQATIGLAGVGTVTLTDSGTVGMTKTNFVGGIDGGGAHTIVITTSDSTVVTATSSATTTTSTNTNTPTFQVVTNNNTTAANLASCLNANSKLTATSLAAVTTVGQDLAGASGNTTITLTDPSTDGMSSVSFTGGTGADLTENEFDVGINVTSTGQFFKLAVENTTHGHGSAFTISLIAGLVLMTQVVTGDLGDTVIATDFDLITSIDPPSYFSGGGASVTPNLVAQFSHNGNDWGGAVELTSDVEADVEAIQFYFLDLTNVIVPYMRIVFNETNAIINTVGIHETFYVHR